MDFARKQLKKHGWTDGQGLGKDEDGIKEAVKVKIKHDKIGVGHNPGEEFSFHWWDHVFNKAASKIQVNATEDGVEIKNTGDTKVSKTKSSKVYDNKAMLYGQFVKGSTLSNGTETREITQEDSSDEEPGEATQCLMPDQEELVFKMCGGRTAHKGARHGLKLNGKLLRIQEQEKNLLDSSKLAKKKDGNAWQNDLQTERSERMAGERSERMAGERSERMAGELVKKDVEKLSNKNKKRKRKQKDEKDEGISNDISLIDSNFEAEKVELKDGELKYEDVEGKIKSKKRKKSKKRQSEDECDHLVGDNEIMTGDEGATGFDLRAKDIEAAGSDLLTEGSEVSKKRKKKKKKNRD